MLLAGLYAKARRLLFRRSRLLQYGDVVPRCAHRRHAVAAKRSKAALDSRWLAESTDRRRAATSGKRSVSTQIAKYDVVSERTGRAPGVCHDADTVVYRD